MSSPSLGFGFGFGLVGVMGEDLVHGLVLSLRLVAVVGRSRTQGSLGYVRVVGKGLGRIIVVTVLLVCLSHLWRPLNHYHC